MATPIVVKSSSNMINCREKKPLNIYGRNNYSGSTITIVTALQLLSNILPGIGYRAGQTF